MKIGVNARFLTKPYTGIGQHTKHLFEALAKLHRDIEILMVTPAPVNEANLDFPPNVTVCVLPEKLPGTAGMRKTFWEQWQVPHFFKKHKVDLVHFPYPCNPWFGFNKPVCVTVHDTIPWEDAAYRRSFLTKLYQDRCKKAVQKADHIFTVSEASKKDIVRICGLDLTQKDPISHPEGNTQKISLSSNAVPPHFGDELPSIHERAVTLEKYGVDPKRPYLFYIGGYDERKNVSTLINVFYRKIAPFYDIDLVLGGGKSHASSLYSSFDLHQQKTDKQAQRGRIITTGFIEEQDLKAFYLSAFAFVHLSLKEGCNLPLLEAATSGVPIVTSDIPVHHEMVQGYATFVAPQNEEAIARVFKKLLDDRTFYERENEKFATYFCPFSWNKTAEQVYEVYKELYISIPGGAS